MTAAPRTELPGAAECAHELLDMVCCLRMDPGLYRMIPLMGIVRNKVLPSRAAEQCAGRTMCRVSTHIINVMPDGRIFPCPDMLYLPEMQQGDVVGLVERRVRVVEVREVALAARDADRRPGADHVAPPRLAGRGPARIRGRRPRRPPAT